MNARLFWVVTLCLGLLVVALSKPTMDSFPTESHVAVKGYGGPVFAFEMAENVGDLIDIFGPPDDPERALRIEQMDRGNNWDFAFMTAYSLFMVSFFVAAWQQSRNRLWVIVAFVGALSGFSDAVENLILLELTGDIAGAPNLEWLAFPVWSKFLSIMICICAAGAFLMYRRPKLWRVLGLVSMCSGLATLAAFYSPSEYAYLISPGTTIGWSIMLLFSAFQSFRTSSA